MALEAIEDQEPPAEASKGEWTEDELSGTNFNYLSEASYFEKAQDFRPLIKAMRVRYLGLKPVKRIIKTEDGEFVQTMYVKDENTQVGINERGLEATLRFLEGRLSQHTTLTSWKEPRMMQAMLDDMDTWFWHMIDNEEEYQWTDECLAELRILVNDLLEFAYRRGVDNKEREGMRPFSREIRRLLGVDSGSDEYSPPKEAQNIQKIANDLDKY